MSEVRVDPYRNTRRIGTVILLLIATYLVLPMFVGVIQGVQTGEIWDPITGEPVQSLKDADGCKTEAERLIRATANMTRLESSWEEKHREWTTRCRNDHPGIWDLLNMSRTNLKSRLVPPTAPQE